MELSALRDYLIIGSYLVGSFFYGALWRELRALKNEVESMRQTMAHEKGLREGLDLDRRVSRLERI